VAQAGVKLGKQAYDIVPGMIKAGGDGVQGASFFKGVGFPAIEGWYSTTASPDLVKDPNMTAWVAKFTDKYKTGPTNYSITAYDGAQVVIDAIKRVAASGKPINRDTVRDAMQETKLKTLQGDISFDANGDMVNKVVSVYQYKLDKGKPDDNYDAQQHYVGVAPGAPQS
jgi:branched-chain amino acid transport system substrate-binding protein